jgi:hypothetical protein
MKTNGERRGEAAGPAKTAALMLAFLMACAAIPAAKGTGILSMKEDELVKGAELIFQGYVAKIDRRISSLRTTQDARLPHTFVTFQVERVLKGRLTDTSGRFTLRLMGGPDPAAARFLQVEGCPDFDMGERVVLFVRRNGLSICPVVGWAQGRFRIAEGALFSETGREVWLTAQNKLALGRKQELEEVRTHHRGGNVYSHIVDGPNKVEGAEPQPAPRGTRLGVSAFLNRIIARVTALHSASELAAMPAVKSAAPDQPVYVAQPAATGGGARQE